jgi:mRNA-degrading endonuclease YafQ of YafQ-DinJ toxin-antitoxin module
MRTVVWGGTFKRAYKRTLRKHAERVGAIDETLTVLATDPFDPRLETHKLKGRLTGAWACSAGYDLRIVFDFVGSPGQKEKDILLISVGTHDEVY